MARKGVSSIPYGLVTGSAVFTEEDATNIIEASKRGINPSISSLRKAIGAICSDYVEIHTVLDVDEVESVKEFAGCDSLCEALATIAKEHIHDLKKQPRTEQPIC